MAGESPDRSKQHEDSGGSAGSGADEELREAVSAWVRPPSGGSAKTKSGAAGEDSAGTVKVADQSGKGAAEEGSGTAEDAASVPDDTFTEDGSGKDTGTPAADGDAAPVAEDAPADLDAEDTPGSAEDDESASGSAEDAPAAGADSAAKDESGSAAEDAGKGATAGAAVAAAKDDRESADEDDTEDASGSAKDSAKDTGTPDTEGDDEAPAPAAEGTAAKDESGSAAEDAEKRATAGAAVAAAKNDAEDAVKAASGSAEDSAKDTGTPDAEGDDAPAPAAEGTAATPPKDDPASTPKDASGSAKDTGTPGPEGEDDAPVTAPKGAAGEPEDAPAAKGDEDVAAPAAKDAEGEPEDAPAAKGDEDADGGPEGSAKSAPLPAPRGDTKAPGKPVDTPTTALKSPAAKKPQVDQPTTMLKVGGKAKPAAAEQEAERTSKFVALKPDLKGPSPRVEETRAVPQVGPERTTQQPLPPKPPLDLLAELTNTPPPPETPVRTLVRRVKIWTPLVILLVVILGVVQAMRPLPQPTLALTAKDSFTFDGGKQDIPWPADGQAAMDVQGIGSFGSSGSGKPVPIASVAKVMTAYLILRDHPLKSGAPGPKIRIDKTAQAQSKAGQESTVDVTAGDEITQREALEGVLIASANNVARLLARWDAGSEKAFVAKMNAAAKGLGMTGTTYTDPSGLTNSTVSTAVDQVKLAKAAMTQPAFREVAAMMSYTDYKGTYHSNWNQLVGHNNVVGIKTGTTTSALGNLVFAAKQDVGGETRTIIGAVLRQPPSKRDNSILSAAMDSSDALIRAGQGALKSETVLKKGTVVGYVDDGLGGETPVEVTEDVKAAGWAGLKVKLSFTSGTIPHTAKAGTEVGSLTVGDGSSAGAVKVPVALRADLAEPGLGAKLTRIG
ncbi:D-alanyl-D-alanine carboxypeptidase [Streptomyces seoulensis]|uniref:D-alanyl-D-alanine carboxypeptidase n=1 Tax=Streptomyces seoulensis TaxID=73044 RepID=UPI003C2E89C8